jgi:hypothetical protein
MDQTLLITLLPELVCFIWSPIWTFISFSSGFMGAAFLYIMYSTSCAIPDKHPNPLGIC